MFVVAAAEGPPAELVGLAELVTVRFPWGSLLRGCVGLDPVVAAGLADLVRPCGRLELLLAPAERDRLAGIPTKSAEVVGAATLAFETLGFRLELGRLTSDDEILASGSTWARRLRSNGQAGARPVTLVRLRSSER
ncbi:MAG TPA: hypothetical protein VKR30_04680 [Candidatus Limnocylindrales bacterium]|nr:hypothetical protein [Candidatus Limnocylindrales bacterium]